jgi:hypothetical protein
MSSSVMSMARAPRRCRRRQSVDLIEEALAELYAGRDPVTGSRSADPFATYKSVDGRRERHAVAGFDLTFTVPKSLSAAVGDE